MTVSSAEPSADIMVACSNNYPNCRNGGSHAVLASQCACHVAREAAATVLPKVTLKDSAASEPQGA